MSNAEWSNFTQPIADENPSGPDLEYDDIYGAFERACRGREEQQFGETIIEAEPPDWENVIGHGTDLTGRTHDLRIAVAVTEAQLHRDGIASLPGMLKLLATWIANEWPTLHPLPDADDADDPTIRLNALLALSDVDRMRDAFGALVLSTTPNGNREVRWTDLRDLLESESEANDDPARRTALETIFLEDDIDALAERLRHLTDSETALTLLENTLAEQVGPGHAIRFDILRKQIGEVSSALRERLSRRGVSLTVADPLPSPEPDEPSGANEPAAAPTGNAATDPTPEQWVIRDREDVRLALDRICRYYEQHEPSSPIPLLLTRASRLVSMSFMDILQDLAPEGLPQAKSLRGGSD